MPFNMTPYLEARVLNLILRRSNTGAGTGYLGLFTAFDPTADGTSFTEISTSGTGYARQPITFAAFAGGASANSTVLSFPAATVDWGIPTYMGIFDSLAGGNMLYWGAVQNPSDIGIGEQFDVAIGGLTVAISGLITPALASKLGEHTLRNNIYPSPSGVFAAVLTSFTNESSYSECVDANYSRVSVVFGTTAGGPTPEATANTSDVTWGAAAGSYTANYLALFDMALGGTMLLRGPFAPTRSIVPGKVLKIPAGALVATAD